MEPAKKWLPTQTFVYAVKCREDDNKECCGIFPSIHEMRKRQSRVAVTTQALCKTKPRRQSSDYGTYAVRNTSANSRTYNNHRCTVSKNSPVSHRFYSTVFHDFRTWNSRLSRLTCQALQTISFCSFHQGWLGCWQSMRHASSHRQRWGLELAQCAAPLTLGLVLYILRAQLSLWVSLAKGQWCGPVLQVEPLAPAICYPCRRLSPHPDAPNPGVMACHSLRRGHRWTLLYLPENLIS